MEKRVERPHDHVTSAGQSLNIKVKMTEWWDEDTAASKTGARAAASRNQYHRGQKSEVEISEREKNMELASV